MSAVTAAAPTDRAATTRVRPGRGVLRAVLGSPKALVGAILLLIFVVAAIVPQLFTSVHNPNQRFEQLLPPGAGHLLGTNAFGQDIWAQLVYGTRLSLVVAVVAGALASVLSVIIGVSAAYLGGLAEDLLSLLTDVFLVIPAFPLIIVIAAYAGGGNMAVVIGSW